MRIRTPSLYRLVGLLLILLIVTSGWSLNRTEALSRKATELPGSASFTWATASTTCPDALTFGVSIVCAIESKGERDSYPFSATQGDKVKVIFARTSGTLDPAVHVFDSSGAQICYDFTSGTMAEIGSCTLPSTGVYTVSVDDTFLTNTGSYLIHSQRLNDPLNAQFLAYGQILSGDISLQAEFDTFTIRAVAGDAVKIKMNQTSGTLRPRLRLYTPDGTLLCSAFSSDVSVEIKSCSLPSTGAYTLLADDTNGSRTGSYTLNLECLNARCGPILTFLPLVIR